MENPCTVCGNTNYTNRTKTHVFTAPNGEKVLVNNIPVTECMQCGEQTLSFETTQHIMDIVNSASNHALSATQTMPMYEYS